MIEQENLKPICFECAIKDKDFEVVLPNAEQLDEIIKALNNDPNPPTRDEFLADIKRKLTAMKIQFCEAQEKRG